MTTAARKVEQTNDVLQLAAAKRRLRIAKAREHLLDFTMFTMPHPEDNGDGELSRYQVEQHHRLLAEALEKVERGEILRLAISMAPQHGKSEIASRRFPAWYMGRNPYKNLMLGTYSQDFANNFGDQVREIIQSRQFRQVFSECELRKGSKAKDEMYTTENGLLAFLGRGGAGTGKPSDLFLVDDPIKDDQEAQSSAIREAVWQWFTKVAYTRLHAASAVVVIQTRWHEDDLIGRLCDPSNPNYDEKIAKEWTYLNIPAVITDPELARALGIELVAQTDPDVIDTFGDKPMSALWGKRFTLRHLATAKRLNPRGFSALYMGQPTPEDGDYFKRVDLVEYKSPGDLPKNLRKYAASDHAVTEKQENDPVCLGVVGIDENDHIWVLPDVVWDRMETDATVENMLALMRRHKPMLWWAENDVINKAIGPFLRRRMMEEKVYTAIDPKTPSKDKRARARSIQGRVQMRMVHFPAFAPWWQDAKAELLKFPNGAHDDFVDWLSWIGIGMDSEIAANKPKTPEKVVRVGSMAWLKAQSIREQRDRERIAARGGM